MAEFDAKVNMSLDEIIKMEKKKKAASAKAAGRGRRGMSIGRRGTRGLRGGRGSLKGNSRGGGRFQNRQMQNVKRRGQWQRFSQSGVRGGRIGKRFNNRNFKGANLRRSQSNMSLNSMKSNSNQNGSFMRGFNSRRGGRFGSFRRSRSRSRSNLSRTNSMQNLKDPLSVYNRLGYQSPKQIAYRNRVKRAKQLLLQRQNKKLGIPNRFAAARNSPAHRRSMSATRRQNRMSQKLMRVNPMHQNPAAINFLNAITDQRQIPMYQETNMSMPRGRSPFRQNMGGRGGQRRGRSRSRSRNRNFAIANSIMGVQGNPEDRSFSEVLYSLPGNFGVTGRTLNDRFSY